MLFRTVGLFLLCVSMGMCATIGHYQTQSNEEEEVEALAADSAAVTEAAAADALFGDQLLAKILSVDKPAAKKPEVDVPVSDVVPAAEAVKQEQTSSEEEWNEIRPVDINQSLDRALAHEFDSSWSLNSIRNGFQTVHGYFDSLVELVGGHDGVCEYRCKYGKSEPLQLTYRGNAHDVRMRKSLRLRRR